MDGHCAVVHVVSVQPSTAAAEVSGLKSPSGHAAFDAWIPDSSLWVNVARSSPAGAQLVQPTGITVARSPLMIVMPRSVAMQMPAFGTSVGWQFLLPQRAGGPASALGLHVEFPDPAQSSAGLATLIQLQQMLQKVLGTGAQTLAAFTDFVFNVQVTRDSGGNGALATLASLAQRNERPVTIASEQAIAQYNRAHPQDQLSGRYPVQGTPQLDYPYVTTTSDHLKLKAARAFEKALRSDLRDVLRALRGLPLRDRERTRVDRPVRPEHRASRPHPRRPPPGMRRPASRPGRGSASDPGTSCCLTSRSRWPPRSGSAAPPWSRC